MERPGPKPTFVILFFSLFLALVSCEYEFVEYDTPDPTIQISFSNDIVPLFTKNSCITCHQTGFTAIDFTSDKAYKTIVPALIDTVKPELSKIYLFPNPSSTNHQFKKYTPAEAAIVLNWILQGAKNN